MSKLETLPLMQRMNIPIKGKDSEFGGMLSVTSMRNTVIERRVVTPIDTFSPNDNHRVLCKFIFVVE